MANIKVELSHPIIDGMPLSFKAPCDCTAVTGIKVEYPNGDSTVSKVFTFTDAHGNDLTGTGNLFAAGAMVRVILDTGANKAFIQNADTNAYLENELKGKAPAGYGLGSAVVIDYSAIDTTVKPGFYCFNYTGTIGGISANFWYMFVTAHNDTTFCTQRLYPCTSARRELIRHRHEGTWGEWVDCSPSAFAPSGYGLGGDFSNITDANLATVTGKYATTESTLNLPVDGRFGVLDVNTRRADKGITQIFYPETAGYQGHILVRACNNGTWGEWEWVNPPMLPGAEYRTTERYNGAAVYAKRITYTVPENIGGNSYVDFVIPLGITGNKDKNVRIVAWCGTQPLPLLSKTGGFVVLNNLYDNELAIRTYNFTLSANLSITFDLYYTKV